MVKLNLAYTSKINPEGASPVLTVPQVWQGLQRKIRFAQEFVPIIESSEVYSDKDGIVERRVVFKKGSGPKDEATETVTSFEPAWVDFKQEDGTYVRNIVSDGPSGDLNDLHMTYVFELNISRIADDDKESAAKELEKFKGNSKMAVESSIKVIRDMVKDGRIK